MRGSDGRLYGLPECLLGRYRITQQEEAAIDPQYLPQQVPQAIPANVSEQIARSMPSWLKDEFTCTANHWYHTP